jgi:hypothetical protein
MWRDELASQHVFLVGGEPAVDHEEAIHAGVVQRVVYIPVQG